MKIKKLIPAPESKNCKDYQISNTEDQIEINTTSKEIYSYILSTEYGSILLKGRFQGSIQLDLAKAQGEEDYYLLSIFNLKDEFTYKVVMSAKNEGQK